MEYKDNDYELLYLISENNEDAKDLMYRKYKKMVSIKAKKFYPHVRDYGIDLNDIIQEAMIGFTKALNRYKENREASFETFANKCIELHLLSYARTVKNNKNILLNTSLSMDEISDKGKSILDLVSDKNTDNPEELMYNNEITKKINNVINKEMSLLEKNVFSLRSKGYSYKEISKKLNITIKSAEHAYKRAKDKLEIIK